VWLLYIHQEKKRKGDSSITRRLLLTATRNTLAALYIALFENAVLTIKVLANNDLQLIWSFEMITPNIYQKFVQWEFIFGCFELFIVFLMHGPICVPKAPAHFAATGSLSKSLRLFGWYHCLDQRQQEEISHVLLCTKALLAATKDEPRARS
jgi:hypothetical protein